MWIYCCPYPDLSVLFPNHFLSEIADLLEVVPTVEISSPARYSWISTASTLCLCFLLIVEASH